MKELFFEFLKNPQEIGSICPSSRKLAKSLADTVKLLPALDVVQVGAGTGVITEFLPKSGLTVVEINELLAERLRNKISDVQILTGCGVEHLSDISREFGCVITIPLINNPMAPKFINVLQTLRQRKILQWCVIYSYGMTSPLKEVGFEFSKKSRIVWSNLPPARVWSYW
ncbi:MAG: class I SAM-dependent methyltransferase [Polynucleobacter sp.]